MLKIHTLYFPDIFLLFRKSFAEASSKGAICTTSGQVITAQPQVLMGAKHTIFRLQ